MKISLHLGVQMYMIMNEKERVYFQIITFTT